MRRLGWIGVGLFVLGACGDDPTVTEQAEDLLGSICDAAFRCCDRGEVDYFFGQFTDEENCQARLSNAAELSAAFNGTLPLEDVGVFLPNLAVLQKAVDEGRADFDEAMFKACKARIEDALCAQEVEEEPVDGCVPPEPVEESPCDINLLLVGRLGDGETCSSPGLAFECKTGLTCARYSSLGVEGVCVEPGDVGAYCFSDGECQEDLFCALADGTCQVPSAEGEACAYADPEDPAPLATTLLIKCEEGLSCDPMSQTCVAACQRGASCSSDSQCDDSAGLLCIPGAAGRCDLPRAKGEPCGSQNTDVYCQDGLYCAYDPGAQDYLCTDKLVDTTPCGTSVQCQSGFCNGVCQPQVAPGMECPTFNSLECAGGYCYTTLVNQACTAVPECLCDDSGGPGVGLCLPVCLATVADGLACTQNLECASGACINLLCATPPLANGAECASSNQCESGFCNTAAVSPTCRELPLANGTACNFNGYCASGVCFGGQCVDGSTQGTECNTPANADCALGLFCDDVMDPPVCMPQLRAGEVCERTEQCYGSCTTRYGRKICDSTPAVNELTCDGV